MSAATMDEGRLTTVIVPRKWVGSRWLTPDGAYHMSAAIVDYVNDVQQAGVFARHEMPAKAMQAYHADYYLAQVNNGGHSQFIGNSGELLRTITADALAGLEAMGRRWPTAKSCSRWPHGPPRTSPDAGAQDGFGVRAEPLDGLDTRFYAAEAETPIAPLAARWIAGLARVAHRGGRSGTLPRSQRSPPPTQSGPPPRLEERGRKSAIS